MLREFYLHSSACSWKDINYLETVLETNINGNFLLLDKCPLL